jgi:hypothetical protein
MPYYNIMVTRAYHPEGPHRLVPTSGADHALTWPEAVAEWQRRTSWESYYRPAATDERGGDSHLLYHVVPA